MMEEDLNKAGFKPKFTSEFSMGSLDFERYDKWLMFIERYSAEINSMEVPSLELVQNYFAGLNVLYKNWRAIISIASVIEKIDGAFDKCRKEKRRWENSKDTGIPFSKILILQLVDELDGIHTKLMQIKQVIGLGIVVKRNMTTKEKIRQGIKPAKNYENLPEA